MTLQRAQFTKRPFNPKVFDAASRAGYTPLQCKILSGRLQDKHAEDIKRIVSPTMSHLDHPLGLPDVGPAVDRIVAAIVAKEHIILACDFDADGLSSKTVIHYALLQFGVDPPLIHTFIGHRARDGYGVSENLAERIIAEAPRPCLVITADQGSADHHRIARLKEHGIDTVVTDHHGIPADGPPPMAVACVNPLRTGSVYPDPHIAGVFVAFLVMCAVRLRLIKEGVLSADAPKLSHLADIVSVGVVADCTSINSTNNRAMLNYGLYLMNKDARPAWRAIRRLFDKQTPFTAQDIAFTIGPLVNCASRIDDYNDAVNFLMSEDDEQADRALAVLNERNLERRAIEQGMTKSALEIAEGMLKDNRNAFAIYLPNGQGSIHGIVASRVVQATGRPTAMLAPKPGVEGVLTTSMRSIPEVHMLQVLEGIKQRYPHILLAGGGHAGAAGAALKLDQLDNFAQAFEELVNEQLAGRVPVPKVFIDAELPNDADFDTVTQINALGPFGREFDEPLFALRGKIVSAKVLKEKHLKVVLQIANGRNFEAIWFGAIGAPDAQGNPAPPPIDYQRPATFAVQLSVNEYRGKRSLQLMIRDAHN